MLDIIPHESVRQSDALLPIQAHLTLKGRNIPFAKRVKYLDTIFNNELHGEY